MGARVGLTGSTTADGSTAGRSAGERTTAHVWGEAAWHEPQSQSNPRLEAPSLTAIVVCEPMFVSAEAALDMSPQAMLDERPSSESSSGSYPEQPRHQTVNSPVSARTHRLARDGLRMPKSTAIPVRVSPESRSMSAPRADTPRPRH